MLFLALEKVSEFVSRRLQQQEFVSGIRFGNISCNIVDTELGKV